MVRRSARLSLSAALLALCACQLLNPKWDPYGDESEAGSGDATAEVSTGASASDSGSESGSSASSTTSTTSSGSDSASTSAGTTTAETTAADTSSSTAGETSTGTSTTGDPECQPLDAQCVDKSDCCACTSCVDGTCQADIGLACGEAIDCAALSCGPDGTGRCRACAGQEHGRCDAGGACVPAEPSGCLDNGEGEIAISCTLSCVKDIQACPQLVAVDSLVANAYCLNDGSITAGCHDQCANEALYSEIRQFRCWEGGCKTKGAAIDCDKYRCDLDTDVCFESCTGNQQCTFAFTCMDNMCVP